MFDYYCKFDSEEQAMSVLYRREGIIEANEELGIEANEGSLVPNFDCIDILGLIYEPTSEEGEEPVALPGFHVNVRNFTQTNLLDNFLVYPSHPRRVWA